MKEYRFTKNNAEKTARTTVISKIPMMVIAICAGVYISEVNSETSMFNNIILMISVIIVLLLTLTIGFYWGYRLLVKRLMGETYYLTENSIDKTTQTGVTVSIAYNEVQNHKLRKNGYFIKAKGKQMYIFSGIDQFEEISNEISAKLK